MDFAGGAHQAQMRLKGIMTPIFDKEIGHRMRVAREKSLRSQGELAALLTTPGNVISAQQVARAEHGRLRHLRVTWARLESVFGRNLPYVLVGRDKASVNETLIAVRYTEHRLKTLRKNANPEIRSRYSTKRRSAKAGTGWV